MLKIRRDNKKSFLIDKGSTFNRSPTALIESYLQIFYKKKFFFRNQQINPHETYLILN